MKIWSSKFRISISALALACVGLAWIGHALASGSYVANPFKKKKDADSAATASPSPSPSASAAEAKASSAPKGKPFKR
jgi:hypothetical protein